MSLRRSLRALPPLVAAAVIVFFVSLAFFVLALVSAEADDGANIGAGIALLSMIATLPAAGFGAVAARSTRIRRRTAAVVTAVLLLVFASQGLMLLGMGLLEGLRN